MMDSTIHRREENCDCAIGTTCWDYWHTVGLLVGIGFTRFEAMERAQREVRTIAFEKAHPDIQGDPDPNSYSEEQSS